ncbi:MAG: hypothetical protein AAF899_08225 [Pseudomonadota bacterium]
MPDDAPHPDAPTCASVSAGVDDGHTSCAATAEERAREAHRRGDWPGEVQAWRRAAALTGRIDFAICEAEAMRRAGRDGDACHRLRTLALSAPDSAAVLSALGSAAEAAGQHRLAASAARRLSVLRPNDLQAHLRALTLARALGDRAEAVEMLAEMLSRWPDDPRLLEIAARRARDTEGADAALGVVEHALTTAPGDAALLRLSASLLLDLDRSAEAVTRLDRLLRDDGGDRDALALMARAEEAAGLPARAAMRWRMIAMEAAADTLAEEAAMALARLDNPSDLGLARALLTVAATHPDAARPLVAAARAFARAGGRDHALGCWYRALAIDGSDPAAWAEAAGLLREAGRLRDALHLLDQGLQQAPDAPELLSDSALVAGSLGLHERAVATLRRLRARLEDRLEAPADAARREADHSEWRSAIHRLACQHLDADERAEAAEVAAALAERAPDDPDAYALLAETAPCSDFAEAARRFALRHPDNARAAFCMARLALRHGGLEEARGFLSAHGAPSEVTVQASPAMRLYDTLTGLAPAQADRGRSVVIDATAFCGPDAPLAFDEAMTWFRGRAWPAAVGGDNTPRFRVIRREVACIEMPAPRLGGRGVAKRAGKDREARDRLFLPRDGDVILTPCSGSSADADLDTLAAWKAAGARVVTLLHDLDRYLGQSWQGRRQVALARSRISTAISFSVAACALDQASAATWIACGGGSAPVIDLPPIQHWQSPWAEQRLSSSSVGPDTVAVAVSGLPWSAIERVVDELMPVLGAAGLSPNGLRLIGAPDDHDGPLSRTLQGVAPRERCTDGAASATADAGMIVLPDALPQHSLWAAKAVAAGLLPVTFAMPSADERQMAPGDPARWRDLRRIFRYMRDPARRRRALHGLRRAAALRGDAAPAEGIARALRPVLDPADGPLIDRAFLEPPIHAASEDGPPTLLMCPTSTAESAALAHAAIIRQALAAKGRPVALLHDPAEAREAILARPEARVLLHLDASTLSGSGASGIGPVAQPWIDLVTHRIGANRQRDLAIIVHGAENARSSAEAAITALARRGADIRIAGVGAARRLQLPSIPLPVPRGSAWAATSGAPACESDATPWAAQDAGCIEAWIDDGGGHGLTANLRAICAAASLRCRLHSPAATIEGATQHADAMGPDSQTVAIPRQAGLGEDPDAQTPICRVVARGDAVHAARAMLSDDVPVVVLPAVADPELAEAVLVSSLEGLPALLERLQRPAFREGVLRRQRSFAERYSPLAVFDAVASGSDTAPTQPPPLHPLPLALMAAAPLAARADLIACAFRGTPATPCLVARLAEADEHGPAARQQVLTDLAVEALAGGRAVDLDRAGCGDAVPSHALDALDGDDLVSLPALMMVEHADAVEVAANAIGRGGCRAGCSGTPPSGALIDRLAGLSSPDLPMSDRIEILVAAAEREAERLETAPLTDPWRRAPRLTTHAPIPGPVWHARRQHRLSILAAVEPQFRALRLARSFMLPDPDPVSAARMARLDPATWLDRLRAAAVAAGHRLVDDVPDAGTASGAVSAAGRWADRFAAACDAARAFAAASPRLQTGDNSALIRRTRLSDRAVGGMPPHG